MTVRATFRSPVGSLAVEVTDRGVCGVQFSGRGRARPSITGAAHDHLAAALDWLAANGRNPVPIIVPCHRVVAANGGLGGYGGVLEMKRRLLAREAIHRP